MMIIMNSITWLTVLTGFFFSGTLALPLLPDYGPSGEKESKQQLDISVLNADLAFGPYSDLARNSSLGENLLFSPLGLASSLAQLSQVSGSPTRAELLAALGLRANVTEERVSSTLSALSELEQALTLTFPGERGRAQLGVWNGLYRELQPQLDYQRLLSEQARPPQTLETLIKDMQLSSQNGSGKLTLTNHILFKGRWEQPFNRRHTVNRRFHVNATSSVEVPMMFRDDSAELRMLYDTNCSTTVVRLPYSGRLASLLLLPKAEVQPLEDCLCTSRMDFWLSNLKPGRAEIRFPKFLMKKSYSLESLLKSSGVSSVFSIFADLSVGPPKRTLKLIQAVHEVTLELDETKSEEGGSPGVKLDFSVPARITFDRPFMLIVYDELTGFILLLAKIIDPTEM